MKVAIVGAGIAGLSCAAKLRSQGITPTLFDKGKRAGGRLSTLTIDDRAWDFGCPYIKVTKKEFAEEAQRWIALGWLAPWADGPAGALVGVPSMASIIERQCADHHVQFLSKVQQIEREERHWFLTGPDLREGPFDAIVLALPSEQAAPLLSLVDLSMAREAASARSAPCWSLMVAFDGPLAGSGDFHLGDGVIAGAFQTNSKPQRYGAETWVIQASPSWSQQHLEEDGQQVAAALLEHFRALHGYALPPHHFLKAHRWRFAHSYGHCGKILWNAELRLGACGDWCTGFGVEGAWLSGQDLAEYMMKDLS
jgi:renalase